jgi:hypothetical protein
LEITKIDLGFYFNKKGCKKKRKPVNFAIIQFKQENGITKLFDIINMQKKINENIYRIKSHKTTLDYNPLDGDEEGSDFEGKQENKIDEDGFVTVRKNTTSNRYSNSDVGLSFKIKKNQDYKTERKKEKLPFWNHEILNKKKQSIFPT